MQRYKDSVEVQNSSRVSAGCTRHDNVLHLKLTMDYLSIDDSGMFTATARNLVGEASTSSQLTVTSKSDVTF